MQAETCYWCKDRCSESQCVTSNLLNTFWANRLFVVGLFLQRQSAKDASSSADVFKISVYIKVTHAPSLCNLFTL